MESSTLPPIGFSFGDLFSLDPAAVTRVVGSPYFVYVFLSIVFLSVLFIAAARVYRHGIVRAIRALGFTKSADWVEYWLESSWTFLK